MKRALRIGSMVLGVSGVLVTSTGCDGDDDGTTTAGTVGSTTDATSTAGTTSTTTSGTTSTTSAGSTSAATDGGSSDGGSTTAAGPTWDNFASGFFETYCWECHGPGDTMRDYSLLPAVMAEANTIRCGTGPQSDPPDNCAGEPPAGQFPVGQTVPSDAERATLVEWIDAGLP